MISIQLFGTPQILWHGRPLVLRRRKSRALLYYVAAQVEPVPRDRLLALLWPDHPAATARHNLRSTIHSVRRATHQALVVDGDTLALAEECQVDIRTFVQVLTAADASLDTLTAALARYRGDFLSDFHLPDAPDFDDWAALERERLRRLAIRGYSRVSQLHEAQGDYCAALSALERALRLDPFQEDLQRSCLRLLYLAGDRAGAIRRFEEFSRLLAEEMGVPPMAETQALYDAIITDQALPEESGRSAPPTPGQTTAAAKAATVAAPPPPPPSNEPADPPFVGRRTHLEALHQLYHSRKLVLVEGEAGIGKTRLVDTFLASLAAVGQADHACLAMRGSARELESRLPYQPMIEALRSLLAWSGWPALYRRLNVPSLWLAELTRLIPELAVEQPTLGPGERSPDESRLWEGVSQFLIAVARQQPLLLVLDDLHWGDASTLGLLGYVIRQAGHAHVPLYFLATARPVSQRSQLALLFHSLLREGRLERISLGPLQPDEVIALARQLSPQYGYPLGNWLNRSSEGHPFVLVELIRHAREHRLLLPDGTVNLNRLPGAPVVPQTVYELLQARLETLSDAARRVLDAAAIVGREFDFEVVARVAALSDSAALDALDELQRARLISPVGAHLFAFDHTLTREVVHREVSGVREGFLHRRVAAALESIHHHRLDEVAGLIAHHYAEGGLPELASKFARRAADRAVHLAAWTEAIQFYRQALSGAPPSHRAGILASLGVAQLQAGTSAQAGETARQAVELALQQKDRSALIRGLYVLAEALFLQGRYRELIEMAQQMAHQDELEVGYWVEFVWGAALAQEGLELQEAARHLRQAEALLQAAPGPVQQVRLAQIQFELGNIAAQMGDLAQAIAHYQKTRQLTAEADSEELQRWHILSHNNLAYHLHLLGDPAAADHVQQGLALARETGALSLLPYLLSTAGEIALAQEEWSVAEGYFTQGLALAERLTHPERIAGLTANLGRVALAKGQHNLAIHRFSTALAHADRLHHNHLAARVRLWLAPLLPPEERRQRLQEARTLIELGGYRHLQDRLDALTWEDQAGDDPGGVP
uniref:AAA family ATPase n=1 Tax=Litorilinea aerophila TaxID=1204385 RepID=A0A540VF23_9CHLR